MGRTCYGWLNGLLVKEALHTLDMSIYRMGPPKGDPSYDVCSVITLHMPLAGSLG